MTKIQKFPPHVTLLAQPNITPLEFKIRTSVRLSVFYPRVKSFTFSDVSMFPALTKFNKIMEPPVTSAVKAKDTVRQADDIPRKLKPSKLNSIFLRSLR